MSTTASSTHRLHALLGASAGIASASVISWNYDRFGTIAPTDTAGVEASANWNNSWPSDPVTDLVDDQGAATTLDLAYESFNNWSIQGTTPALDGDGTANKRLLNGYLNAGPAAWNPSPTYSRVTLAEIPFSTYDVIVYFSSDAAGREGDVTDGTTTFSFNTVGATSVSGTDALFAPTTDTLGTYGTAANYAVFQGLAGAGQTFTVQMRDNDEWGGIAGFQVVETTAIPEPASAALLLGAAGLAGSVLRRRRSA